MAYEIVGIHEERKAGARRLRNDPLDHRRSGNPRYETHGCNQGQEGNRCNPTLTNVNGVNEDECGRRALLPAAGRLPRELLLPYLRADLPSDFCKPGCAGGQAPICDAGGDADCAQLGDGG